jgi:hypothetical protein
MTGAFHSSRDPEAELRQLRTRFEAVSRRHDRERRLRRLDRWASASALVVIAGLAGYWALALLSPWPPLVTLKHLAASPNCNAARAVGTSASTPLQS